MVKICLYFYMYLCMLIVSKFFSCISLDQYDNIDNSIIIKRNIYNVISHHPVSINRNIIYDCIVVKCNIVP